MCGIAGIYGVSDKTLVKRMCDKIIHRGPDEEGYYVADNVSLGLRRLSIIDLGTSKYFVVEVFYVILCGMTHTLFGIW